MCCFHTLFGTCQCNLVYNNDYVTYDIYVLDDNKDNNDNGRDESNGRMSSRDHHIILRVVPVVFVVSVVVQISVAVLYLL